MSDIDTIAKEFVEKNSSNENTRAMADKYAIEIKKMLVDEIRNRGITNYNGVSFLEYVDVKVSYDSKNGYVIGVFFDKDKFTSKSLYNKELNVYLPVLINNKLAHSSLINGSHWDIDRNGQYTVNSDKFIDEKYKGFIQECATKFKAKHKECDVYINENIYDI